MKRFALFIAAAALLSPAALSPAAVAHEIKKPVQAPTLPSAEDIAQIQAQMPDFNKIMSGLKGVMEDPQMQKSMKSTLGTLSEKMDGEDFKAKTEDGMPDMNAMMGAMLSLMGDEAVMGEMLKAMEPMMETMPKIMEDAMPKTAVPQ